jgi:hypothetical protein
MAPLFPTAGFPGISLAIPPVIPVDPDMVFSGPGAAVFHNGSRGSNFYNDLRLGDADSNG